MNPVFTKYQPVFFLGNPGFWEETPGLSNPYWNRINPVFNPYNPVFKYGVWGGSGSFILGRILAKLIEPLWGPAGIPATSEIRIR
jgi:hypothetical protein